MHSEQIISVLGNCHLDMIDSLLKIELTPEITQIQSKRATQIQWLLSAGRDRKLILWKLLDGVPMRRVYEVQSQQK